jgi:hypothetical protein
MQERGSVPGVERRRDLDACRGVDPPRKMKRRRSVGRPVAWSGRSGGRLVPGALTRQERGAAQGAWTRPAVWMHVGGVDPSRCGPVHERGPVPRRGPAREHRAAHERETSPVAWTGPGPGLARERGPAPRRGPTQEGGAAQERGSVPKRGPVPEVWTRAEACCGRMDADRPGVRRVHPIALARESRSETAG